MPTRPTAAASRPRGAPRLPVLAEPPRIRPSRSSRWRAAVLVAVHLVAAAHIAHWYAAGETLGPVEPSEAMELGRSGVVNAGAVFFAVAILATAVFGRFFCGWGCHLVALQDLCRWLLEKIGIRPRPLGSRWLALVPFVAFAYMFLWPAAYRLAAGLGFPGLSRHFTTTEFWATFPGPGVAIATLAVCGFAAVYLLGAKGFCTYACPYGAIFGLADRVAPLRIRVTDDCSACGHCTAVCTSNVRVHEEVRSHGAVVDPGCMKCLDCVSVCPNDALYLGWGKPSLALAPRATPTPRVRLPRREELAVGAAFVIGYLGFRGLYGVFPFLFSLGLAACLAYLALLAFRLGRTPNVTLRRRVLRRQGRLTPAGRAAVALLALVALAWAHSATVRVARAAGFTAGRGLAGESASAIPPERLGAARRAATWLGRAARWGALDQPDLAPPLQRLGIGLAGAGDLAAARAAFEAAIAAAGPTVDLHYDLGLIHALTGDAAAGVEQFRGALALDPRHRPARENLAGLLASVGRWRESVEEFRRAVDLAPDDAATRLLLARALAGAGEAEAARQELDRARALDPDLAGAEQLAAELAEAR